MLRNKDRRNPYRFHSQNIKHFIQDKIAIHNNNKYLINPSYISGKSIWRDNILK